MTKEFDTIHKAFCKAIIDIIDNGNKQIWFNPDHGLCKNFWYFVCTLHIPRNMKAAMDNEFGEFLTREYGTAVFPFNTGDMAYMDERDHLMMYKNPKRIAHLRKYAE